MLGTAHALNWGYIPSVNCLQFFFAISSISPHYPQQFPRSFTDGLQHQFLPIFFSTHHDSTHQSEPTSHRIVSKVQKIQTIGFYPKPCGTFLTGIHQTGKNLDCAKLWAEDILFLKSPALTMKTTSCEPSDVGFQREVDPSDFVSTYFVQVCENRSRFFFSGR